MPGEDRTEARAAAVVLGAIAILALLFRLPAAVEPLGIDQGLFASGAKALSRGYLLYRDAWDQKPPAIFLTYLAAFRAFGWSPAAIAWIDLLASAGTTLLLFAIARRLAGATAGAAAAALYAALTMPGWLYRHGGFLERGVAETFMSLCIAAAAWCLVSLRASARASIWRAAGFGVACGLAVAFKPNAVLYFPAILIWAAWCCAPNVRSIRVVVAAIAGAVLAPALTFLWLWRSGVLPEARVAILEFNRFYVTQSVAGRHLVLDFAKAVWLRFKTDPLWAAGGIGVVTAAWSAVRSRRVDPLAALGVAWGGAAALAIAANGGWLFNSYFIQALPPLALLAAWATTGVSRRGLVRGIGGAAAILAIAGLLVRKDYPARVFDTARADFQQWRGTGDTAAYLDRFGGYASGGGYSARANAELAGYIRAHSSRDDLIYQFGINSAGVYFSADRLMAQRFLRVNEFVPATFPEPGFALEDVASELSARRPLYVIFERLPGGTPMADAVNRLPAAPGLRMLLESYEREIQIEDFSLFRRRG